MLDPFATDPWYQPESLDEALDIYEAREARFQAQGEPRLDLRGRRNVYVCEDVPYHVFVTIDRDAGVTPFLKTCPFCGGTAQSRCYPRNIPDPELHPEWAARYEWYRPERGEAVDPQLFNHIAKGGLIFREIDPDAVSIGKWLQ